MKSQAEDLQIKSAIEAFQFGKLVAIPTETVYGLSAPINSSELIEKIFTLKERPFFDPLIVHVKDVESAKELTQDWPKIATTLANAFWPGPLTLVLKKNPSKISHLISASLDTVGIRCPAHQLTLAFLKKLNSPLAAPSANKFTKTSPTTSSHVRSAFSQEDVFILEDSSSNSCQVGIESTIVKIESETAVSILRYGMITPEQIKLILGERIEVSHQDSKKEVTSPGQFKTHYQPEFPLVATLKKEPLSDSIKASLESYLDKSSPLVEERPLRGDPTLIARTLYSTLRDPISHNCDYVHLYFDPPPSVTDERYLGIIDRLKKASLFTQGLNF